MKFIVVLHLIAHVFPASAATEYFYMAVDQNSDGYVDYLSVVGKNFSDTKADNDFDGKWDTWTIARGKLSVHIGLNAQRVQSLNLGERFSSMDVVQAILPEKNKWHSSLRLFPADLDYLIGPGWLEKYAEDRGGSEAKGLEDSRYILEKARRQMPRASCELPKAKSASLEGAIQDTFDLKTLESTAPACGKNLERNLGYCFGSAFGSGLINELGIPNGEQILQSVINELANASPGVTCQAPMAHEAASAFSPPQIFLNEDEIRLSVPTANVRSILRHEVLHIALRTACQQISNPGPCSERNDRERIVGQIEAGIKECLGQSNVPTGSILVNVVDDQPKPIPVLTAEVTAPPEFNTASASELIFTQPTAEMLPAPPRLVAITESMAKPVTEYAERTWKKLKPVIDREARLLPVAQAEEAQSTQTNRIKSANQRKLEALNQDSDEPSTTKSVNTVGSPAKSGLGNQEPAGSQEPLANQSADTQDGQAGAQGRSQRTNSSAKPDGADTARQTAANKPESSGPSGQSRTSGAQSSGAKIASRTTASGSPKATAQSPKRNDSSPKSDGPPGVKVSGADREPAAVSPKIMADLLQSGEATAVTARELLNQLEGDPSFARQLKSRGISVRDVVGREYGAPYKSAKVRYLIRGEKLTKMGGIE